MAAFLIAKRLLLWGFAAALAGVYASWFWQSASIYVGAQRTLLEPISATDYAVLALAHAWNIDFALAQGAWREVGGVQTTHPGLPFQLLSWIGYRLALLGADGGAVGRTAAALAHPASAATGIFLVHAVVVAAGLGILGLLAASAGLGATLVAAGILLLCYLLPETLFLNPTNESFSLLWAVLIFLLARPLLLGADVPGQRRSVLRGLLLGTVFGLAYTTKLQYAAWLFAFLSVCVLAALLLRERRRSLLMISLLVTLGFIVSATVLTGLSLGPHGMSAMLLTHLNVAIRTGYYGQGEVGLRSSDQLLHAMFGSFEAMPLFWMVGLVLAGMFAALLLRRSMDREWLATQGVVGTVLAAMSAATLAAAMIHYQHHYMIPVASMLTLLGIWLVSQLSGATGGLLGVAIGALALVQISGAGPTRAAHPPNLAVMGPVATFAPLPTEIAVARALPLGQDELRLWGYASGSWEYRALYAAMWASRADALGAVMRGLPNDRPYIPFNDRVLEPDGWRRFDEIPWRYLILTDKPPVGLALTVQVSGLLSVYERD